MTFFNKTSKMSDGRSRLSGYKYEKITEEKKNKLNNLVQKTPKIDSFLNQTLF